TMRAKGETHLPKFKREEDDDYKKRLQKATLYPTLAETIKQMTGRVFFDPISTENVQEKIKSEILPNIDLLGNDLNVFAMEWFKSALSYGISFVLVDYPVNDNVKTRSDEKKNGVRPYLVHIPPHNVLGFKTAVINGVLSLSQFRYKEISTVDSDEFSSETKELIVVYEIGRVRKYEDVDGEYKLVDEITPKASGKSLNAIPIVPLITNKKGFMNAEPPLMELAYLNIKHWQSQSDQDNILNTARVPLLWASGVTVSDDVEIGKSLILLPENGKIGYIEHSGAAISSGQGSLKELEEQMKVAGAKLLTKTALAMTDSQAKDEQGKEISQLKAMANTLEDSLDQALDFVSMWLNIPQDNAVEITGNIDDDLDPNASMDTVIKLQTSGSLSTRTTFEEAKRRGLISEERTWEDEQERLNSEGLSDGFTEENNRAEDN
ncbi:DUF4055 domain-containing protein, partial [Phocoenobacter skyensis]